MLYEVITYSVSRGHHSYAKRKRLPELQNAEKNLKAVQEQYDFIIQSMKENQGMVLVDTAYYQATENPEEQASNFPTSTVIMAVGAIFLVFVIYKML